MENKDQYEQALESKYDCLLFDLDDTLYPFTSGISAQVTKNIQEYMLQKLEIEESKVPELCLSLYKNYGTTMAGLKAMCYDFDYDDFHSFVHGRLPYNLLKPDPVLRALLLSVPLRKVIFTNADEAHAARALSRLGLEDCFQEIICFETLNPNHKSNMPVDGDEAELGQSSIDVDPAVPRTPVVCKPFENAFEKVFNMAKINPQRTVFFDDSIRNIQTGKRLGLTTVLVGSSHRIAGVDYALDSIHNIKEALPELWEAEEKSESVRYSRKIAIETSVQA
ncbi:HAD hydrolase, subfamily IA [Parasponia andersonii]|uniref:HAD hydrolase, subfamily IA n=1 Tax=Parasponia andersonii TaxID=3476 RepID=A0A2P5DQK4_PARAD|nr:HAD hydrolase, subfamily IA [Parasponia andersonii]